MGNGAIEKQLIRPVFGAIDPPAAPKEQAMVSGSASGATRWLLPLFILALALPILFYFGSLRLSPYRLFLIILFFPSLFAWLSGAAGPIRLPDFIMLSVAIWSASMLILHHGFDSGWEPAGIFVVETFGAYLLARWLVRDFPGFRLMVNSLLLLIVILAPFALIESITGRAIILELGRQIFAVHWEVAMEPRLGLDRAQGTFEHPILFGVVCSSAYALSYYIFRGERPVRGILGAAFSAFCVGLSLSVGAFVSIVTQTGLIAWDKLTRQIAKRWMILLALLIALYVVIDVLSNRTPFEVFISYLTFNIGSAYNRVLIWEFGTNEVYRHPLTGIGLNEWIRPYWMSSSMDNFWLLTAVRYGLPGLGLLVWAIGLICRALARVETAHQKIQDCRKGLLICFAGLAVAMCTVHLWNAAYSLFMFLLGSGLWMLNRDANSGASHAHGRHDPAN